MKNQKIKIGIEAHIQLNTISKLFCGCSTEPAKPNNQVCEICMGMPGARPLFNEKALEKGIALALAFNSQIQKRMAFSRKTYFYPDLAKNYQITQYELPLAKRGIIELSSKKIRIKQLHIEEDPASIKHEETHSLIDYNRSGIPLIELVTEPDFSSVKEVKEFIKELTKTMDYLEMYDPSKFTIRFDVNINVLGHPRVEIKNLNGAKIIEKAVSFEIIRQKNALKTGEKLNQHSAHFDEMTGKITKSRTKETEADYGFIFDTDLPIFDIKESMIENINSKLPELPKQRIKRLIKEHKINKLESEIICKEKLIADLFENTKVEKKRLAKWISGPLRKVMNYNNIIFSQTHITKKEVETLFKQEDKKILNQRTSELVLRELVAKNKKIENIIKKFGFRELDEKELEKLVKEVLLKNREATKQYKEGNEKALRYLIGQVSKATNGCADPKKTIKIIKKKHKIRTP
jgi:aspartyl-tRNA(Asn)/glutamyl-tRNA(Gln) amidotransferase subunit B